MILLWFYRTLCGLNVLYESTHALISFMCLCVSNQQPCLGESVQAHVIQVISQSPGVPMNFQTLCVVLLAICDPLSEIPALPPNIEFELEAILSMQVVF